MQRYGIGFLTGCVCLWATTGWTEEPRYKAIPSLGWSLDRVVDVSSLGDATGVNVALTGTAVGCDQQTNQGALTTDSLGMIYCTADDGGAGGSTNSFQTIATPAGTSPVADSATDTLTITETSFLTITGTAATDTIDITQVTTDLGTDGLIAANAVALTTDTTGNYAAGDAEAGAALTGDSATSFFSTGTLEVGIGGTGATTLTDGGILLGSGTGAITPLGVASNGQVPIGDGTTDPVLAALTGTADEITVTNGAGSITLDIPDPLIVGKGGSGAATFTDGGILLGSGTAAFTALGVASNGQVPIGDGTTDPVLATLTGTANQVVVTNGAGTITLSTPQDIATTSTPTFGDTTIADASPAQLFDPASGDSVHLGLDPGGSPFLISNATDSRNLLILHTETGQLEVPHLNASACDVKGAAGTGALYCGTDATSAGIAGDVTAVGDCTTDACFTAAGTGTSLTPPAGTLTIVGDLTVSETSPATVYDPASGDSTHAGVDPGGAVYLVSNATDSRTLMTLHTETGQPEFPFLNAANCNVQAAAGTGALFCGQVGGWSDGGTDVTLTTSTDNVGIGGASLGKLSVDGDTDEIQLVVQGNATQTTSLAVFENSAGTDQFTVSNAGAVVATSTGTFGGTAQSVITEGLVVNNGSGTDEDDDFTVNVSGGAYEVDAGAATLTSTANDAGWTVVDQTDNQACTTGCTSACLFGQDLAGANKPILSCSDATADICLCMGGS